jgi:exosortase
MLRELALAAIVGAAVAASPFSTTNRLPSLAAGLVAAAALFFLRRRRGRASVDATEGAAHRGLPATVWAAAALLVVLFGPTFRWLYEEWTVSLWTNSHGMFIPLASAYLGHQALQDDAHEEREEASFWGLPIVGVGLLLALVDVAVRTHYLALAGLLVTVPGLCLLWLGPRRTRLLAVPIVLLLLMVPIPNVAGSHLYLRQLTADAVEPLLRGVGLPIYREMTMIATAHQTFVVSNACSGFSTLYASVAVAAILACYTPGWGRRLLVLVLAVPLAVAANVLRVFALIMLTHFLGAWVIDSPLHPGSGLAAFVLVLGALFAVANRSALRRSFA